MTKKKFGEIFLSSILPAIITGGLAFFAGFQTGKVTNNKDTASMHIRSSDNSSVSGNKVIKSDEATFVEGDYIETAFDSTKYLIKK